MFVEKALSTGTPRNYQSSEQDVSECDLVTIKWFATVKEAVFCNFDLAIFPVVSISQPRRYNL